MSYSSVRIGMYDVIKQQLQFDTSGADPGLLNKIIAGGISGAIGAYLANPFDLIKIRQQGELPRIGPNGTIVPAAPQYRHTFDALVQIYKKEGGVPAWFRGVSATVLRAAVLTSAQLSSYDHTKHMLINHTTYFEDRLDTHLVSSLIAGLCTAIASNPVDVVKTRYMNDQKAYKGVVDCLIQTVRESPKSLYKGFIPNYIRLGAHCMFALPLNEQIRKMFGLTTM
jgi:hypothetical protein